MSQDHELKSGSEAEPRALRRSAGLNRIVDELRTAPLPELDWDHIEGELLRRTELEAAARRRRPRPGSMGSVLVFAAAAAAVVMLIAGTTMRPVAPVVADVAPRVVDLATLPTLDGDSESLPVYPISRSLRNSRVQSQLEPVRFTLPGVVTWTLAPNSRAVIETTAVPHVIKLEQGSVVADVVPRTESNQLVEAFVVEAGSTRVAVHGTIFSVALADTRVTVEVMRGSVTVGPTGYRGATTGHLLLSPARAAFDFDTGRLIEMLSPSSETAMIEPEVAQPQAQADPPSAPEVDNAAETPSPAPRVAHGPAPHETSPAPAPDAPEPAPQPAPRLLTVDEARAVLVACLSGTAKHDDSDDTLIIVSSNVRAVLAADGSVNSVRFDPPLRPDLQSRCGGSLFGRRIEGKGSVTFRVTFSAK